jgi:hypothetical protein
MMPRPRLTHMRSQKNTYKPYELMNSMESCVSM